MNAEERFHLFVLPDGVKKISVTKDPKIPNAAVFDFQKEDHTLGNMLRMELLKNSEVLFAGYRMPHPLQHRFVLRIQTTSKTTPMEALSLAVTALINYTSLLEEKFKDEVQRIELAKPRAMPAERDDLDDDDDHMRM